MPRQLKSIQYRITGIVWIAQLVYVIVCLTLLLVLLHSLDLASVSTYDVRLFAILYILIMIIVNVAWRLAIIHRHPYVTIGMVAVAFVVTIGFAQLLIIQNAHSSFDNYYKFRGCTELVSKTTSSAVCKLQSGESITLVQFQDKWYLDGDLPNGWF